MNHQECRNAQLKEVVHIRRSCHKILHALGIGDLGPVTPAVLNINHSLNEIEKKIEWCRDAEIRVDKSIALDNL